MSGVYPRRSPRKPQDPPGAPKNSQETPGPASQENQESPRGSHDTARQPRSVPDSSGALRSLQESQGSPMTSPGMPKSSQEFPAVRRSPQNCPGQLTRSHLTAKVYPRRSPRKPQARPEVSRCSRETLEPVSKNHPGISRSPQGSPGVRKALCDAPAPPGTSLANRAS